MRLPLLLILTMIPSSGFAATRQASIPPSPQAIPTPPRAFLVHGFAQAPWRSFYFMRRDLERLGIETFVPRLRPADARNGLENLSAQLQQQIESRFGPDQPILLIGYSMGGLISRHYLQERGGHQRCTGFITISSPHQGTITSYLYPNQGTREMRPGSDFLRKLDASAHRLKHLPIVSYRTPADIVILPSRSSIWERAENVSVICPLHPMMNASPTLRRDLLRRLRVQRQAL